MGGLSVVESGSRERQGGNPRDTFSFSRVEPWAQQETDAWREGHALMAGASLPQLGSRGQGGG